MFRLKGRDTQPTASLGSLVELAHVVCEVRKKKCEGSDRAPHTRRVVVVAPVVQSQIAASPPVLSTVASSRVLFQTYGRADSPRQVREGASQLSPRKSAWTNHRVLPKQAASGGTEPPFHTTLRKGRNRMSCCQTTKAKSANNGSLLKANSDRGKDSGP